VDFDGAHWAKAIQKPDWYIEFVKYSKQAESRFADGSEALNQFRYQCRHFFELALQGDRVALASTGPDLDEERQPQDTIVVHHTSNKPGYRLSYMNAVHLLNIYASYFARPYDERDKSVKDRPIWSGHFKDGKQVFWGYHWLMRMDGSFERLLGDNQIGWHAGNWEINKRSIGICLDNDYENQDPTDETLQKLAEFIKDKYPNIEPGQIIGHCEARSGTICPGTNFLDSWKKNLLSYLYDS
jgi:hypothetical protein